MELMTDAEADAWFAEQARRREETKPARFELLDAYWHCDQVWESPSEMEKIKAVLDELITDDNGAEADKEQMFRVAKSYWQLYEEIMGKTAAGARRMVKEWLKQVSRKPATVHEFPKTTH